MSSGTGDKLEGKADEIKGNVKQGVGGATGNEEMRSEGQVDEVKGKGKGVLGGAKDMMDKAGDTLGDAADNVKRKMD